MSSAAAVPGRPWPGLDELFGQAPDLAGPLAGMPRAAATEAPVLVLGEPGSGRSTVARALHASSARGSGPLVEVDAGTVPVSLFESEIFGFVAGAFTGAGAAMRGRVERAGGGTLLLDHVEEIPLTVQPKLLRLLAERRYRPLGGEEREADVRFVAVGEEGLAQRVTQGVFRADLFYRLEVLSFRVPPLRERRAALAEIAARLAEEVAARLGREAPPLSAAALGWMAEHAWPGNLRELRNVLERALVLPGGDELDPPPPEPLLGERPRPLAEVEEDEIRRALAYTRGHQSRAAALLGISRKALWQKRKRLGIH